MEGIKECPTNSKKYNEESCKTQIHKLQEEYQQKRHIFNPNNKSPNLFNKRLHLRLQQYYNALNK
jgi:hypothetical protein